VTLSAPGLLLALSDLILKNVEEIIVAVIGERHHTMITDYFLKNI